MYKSIFKLNGIMYVIPKSRRIDITTDVADDISSVGLYICERRIRISAQCIYTQVGLYVHKYIKKTRKTYKCMYIIMY